MNWYGTAGTGTQTSAGTRLNDPDSMCGNAVMYDAGSGVGHILTVGGSPDYTGRCIRYPTMKDCKTTTVQIGIINRNPVNDVPKLLAHDSFFSMTAISTQHTGSCTECSVLISRRFLRNSKRAHYNDLQTKHGTQCNYNKFYGLPSRLRQ